MCGMPRLPAARAGAPSWRCYAIGTTPRFSRHSAPPRSRTGLHPAGLSPFPRGGPPVRPWPPAGRSHCGPPWPHRAGSCAPEGRQTLRPHGPPPLHLWAHPTSQSAPPSGDAPSAAGSTPPPRPGPRNLQLYRIDGGASALESNRSADRPQGGGGPWQRRGLLAHLGRAAGRHLPLRTAPQELAWMITARHCPPSPTLRWILRLGSCLSTCLGEMRSPLMRPASRPLQGRIRS